MTIETALTKINKLTNNQLKYFIKLCNTKITNTQKTDSYRSTRRITRPYDLAKTKFEHELLNVRGYIWTMKSS